jgi:mono/diheme cytochrome c family protein
MDAETPIPGELPGGQRFTSDFGTFIAPNISPDVETGIGSWTDLEIASAVLYGTSPDGTHYYPAFPYASYGRATTQDITDLVAHLRALPAVSRENTPHDVGFPFNIRASVGGWKLLFTSDDWAVQGKLTETEARGRYLVEALGHCTECHTPRNMLGGLDRDQWLQGAANPSGDGRIPGITASQLDWSDSDVIAFLTSGFTPDFDTVGGSMVEVVDNLAQLPRADVEAIVAYLRKVPGPDQDDPVAN